MTFLLHRTYQNKLYQGGLVNLWNATPDEAGGTRLSEMFQTYLEIKSSKRAGDFFSLYSIAQELNLDNNERYKFLTSNAAERDKLLIVKIKYLQELLKQEEKSKDVFHLN